MGLIESKNSSIRVINGEKIQLQKKALFSTWKRTLNNINKMVQNAISNFDNKNIVEKRVLNVFCFPETAIEKLTKH